MLIRKLSFLPKNTDKGNDIIWRRMCSFILWKIIIVLKCNYDYPLAHYALITFMVCWYAVKFTNVFVLYSVILFKICIKEFSNTIPKFSTAQTGARGVMDVPPFHYPTCIDSIKPNVHFSCNFAVINVPRDHTFLDFYRLFVKLKDIKCTENYGKQNVIWK
jgi:hypothetical protein